MIVAMAEKSVGDGNSVGNKFENAPSKPGSPKVPQQSRDLVIDLPAGDGLSPNDDYATAIYLLCRSESHRMMPIGLVDPMIRSAIKLGQMKLYRVNGVPVGLALWAFLSEEVEKRVLAGGTGVKPNELKSGDRLQVVDIVTPLGGADAIRADLKTTVFGSATYRELPKPGKPRPDAGAMTKSAVAPGLSYRPTQQEDIAKLAPRLREQDKMELLAATGRDAAAALSASLANAKRCWSVLLNDEVIAMFGVGHVRERPQHGLIWMLGSDELFQQGRALLHDSPVWLGELMKGHATLGNFVDARNETYIRWLKRLGFQFVRLHEQYGREKKPFWEFSMAAAHVGSRSKQ